MSSLMSPAAAAILTSRSARFINNEWRLVENGSKKFMGQWRALCYSVNYRV